MSLNPSLEKPKILEIGSGTGGLSVALALLGAEVIGIEPDSNGVMASKERAKRYKDIDVKFQGGVAEDLQFEDNSFDMVVSCTVLEHVNDVNKSIQEIFRVLKKGGLVYCELPNNLFPREEHYRIFWPPLLPKGPGKIYAKMRGKNPAFLDHLNYFTPRKAFKSFLDAGFVEVRDLWQDNFLKKLENPESIEADTTKNIIKAFKMLRMEKFLVFLVIGCGFYKAIYVVAKKTI